MSDRWVTPEEMRVLEATASEHAPMAQRFHDDSDSAAYMYMRRVRTFATLEARNAWVERSKGGRYLGRKRQRWYPVQERAQAGRDGDTYDCTPS
jgi:hypothetical protein